MYFQLALLAPAQDINDMPLVLQLMNGLLDNIPVGIVHQGQGLAVVKL